jgi:hypothetical protein
MPDIINTYMIQAYDAIKFSHIHHYSQRLRLLSLLSVSKAEILSLHLRAIYPHLKLIRETKGQTEDSLTTFSFMLRSLTRGISFMNRYNYSSLSCSVLDARSTQLFDSHVVCISPL